MCIYSGQLPINSHHLHLIEQFKCDYTKSKFTRTQYIYTFIHIKHREHIKNTLRYGLFTQQFHASTICPTHHPLYITSVLDSFDVKCWRCVRHKLTSNIMTHIFSIRALSSGLMNIVAIYELIHQHKNGDSLLSILFSRRIYNLLRQEDFC